MATALNDPGDHSSETVAQTFLSVRLREEPPGLPVTPQGLQRAIPRTRGRRTHRPCGLLFHQIRRCDYSFDVTLSVRTSATIAARMSVAKIMGMKFKGSSPRFARGPSTRRRPI